MSAVSEYMQLCRLCLVKDKVDVPIFGEASDLRQIFLKITACLPVKVSEDDNLPKKICDTCLYKLDLLYQFWNTAVNAEKQLISWLGEIGVDVKPKATDTLHIQSHAHPHSIDTEQIVLKKENLESEAKQVEDYIPSQQLVFQSYNQQIAATTGLGNNTASSTALDSTNNFSNTAPSDDFSITAPDEVKRVRTRQASKKLLSAAAPSTSTAVETPPVESMDEDSNDRVGAPDDSEDSMEDAGVRIAKQEAESEEEYDENAESLEPTAFVGVPTSTALCDTDQPGPSGLNKQSTSSDRGCKIEEEQWKEEKTESEVYLVDIESLTSDSTMVQIVYKCDQCDKQFEQNYKLTAHKKSHAEKTLPCGICGKLFKRKTDVVQHEKRHNLEPSFRCTICDKCVKTKSSLEFHMRTHTNDYRFYCEVCNKGFYHRSVMLEHYEVRHNGMKYLCEHCQSEFTDFNYYRRHLKTHDPDQKSIEYQCPHCPKVYTGKDAWRMHIARHINRVFICDICGKSLTTRASLRDHVKIHTGEKSFVCAVCGKAFSNRQMIEAHERVHTKEKPFSCNDCGKKFTQQSTLIVHKRYHTGERPHSCQLCDKKFVTKTLMKNHVKKKHGTSMADL